MREMSFNTQGSTTYLVLKLESDDQLDRLALGMITNNKIPGLLSISPRRVNRDAYLYYGISSLTPLTSAYGVLSSDKRLMMFLQSLCRLASECHEYLLDEDGMMLSPEHVYIQLSTCEIQVPYLPVERARSDTSPYQFVRSVVMNVGNRFATDSKLLPVLYRMVLAEDQFSLTALGEQLAQLQIGGAVQTDKGSAAKVNPAVTAEPVCAPQQHVAPQPVPVVQEPVKVNYKEVPVPAPAAEIKENVQEEKDSVFKKLFGSSKSAEKPTKALKAPKPAKEKPAKSGLGFEFAIPNMCGPEQTAQEVPAVPAPQPEPVKASSMKKQFSNPFQKSPAPAAEAWEAPGQVSTPAPVQQSVPQQNSRQPQGGGYTYNLDGMDSGAPLATSPLMDMGGVNGVPALWLVRRSTSQRVQITHSNFHIGRGQELVDFYVSTSTPYIGVDHAYILIQGNEFYFVDNNSKNHSWLNGTMLEGSRPYPIHAGDHLRLADEYFDVVSC